MVLVKIKWGKEQYDVDVDVGLPVAAFKQELQRLTSVPVEKMKVMGVKQGQLKDDHRLADCGLTPGKVLMLVGSAEAIAPPPSAPILFAEDGAVAAHAATSANSNGLHNVGNTCYLNSALQILRGMPELRDVSRQSRLDLPRLLLMLLGQLDATRDAVSPLPFWLNFIQQHPQFGQTSDEGHMMQHDSQEALCAILASLSQTIDADPALAARYGALYRGQMRSVVTSPENPAVRKEELLPFVVLPCNIAGEVQTLEAGLEQAMDETFAGRAEGAPADAPQVQFLRRNRLERLPEYLFVHFVRFTWRTDTKTKAKILKPITFPFVLDVMNLCSDALKTALAPEREVVRLRRDKEVERRKRLRQKSGADEDPADAASPEAQDSPAQAADVRLENNSGYYELAGVISHKGRDADHGHYCAWARKGAHWLIYDDHNCGAVSEEDVRRLRGIADAHIAYVLLYRSRDPETKLGPLPL
jgi:ubiquitin carboxyl-terminal hydrolase 14